MRFLKLLCRSVGSAFRREMNGHGKVHKEIDVIRIVRYIFYDQLAARVVPEDASIVEAELGVRDLVRSLPRDRPALLEHLQTALVVVPRRSLTVRMNYALIDGFAMCCVAALCRSSLQMLWWLQSKPVPLFRAVGIDASGSTISALRYS